MENHTAKPLVGITGVRVFAVAQDCALIVEMPASECAVCLPEFPDEC
jgi:hypothetical protein